MESLKRVGQGKEASQSNAMQIFELQPGTLVDIQAKLPVTVRLKSMLVGYSTGKYIILQYPDPKRYGNYKDVLTEGNTVIVRYLLEGDKGECFAFKSTILHVVKYPDPLMFIDYPKHIENRQLRSHQRKITNIPAEIALPGSSLGKTGIKGMIVDISSSGCRFVFKSAQKATVKQTQIEVSINTAFHKEPIKVSAKVCNSSFEVDRTFVGIMFTEKEEVIQDLMDVLFLD